MVANSSKDSFGILVVAEINGAKKHMDVDSLIGLAHYARNMESKPKLVVLNGGILPEMPVNRGGERNKDALRVANVEDLEAAAAVVKPHIERLRNALPEAEFIYVMGKDDQSNLDTIKLDFARLYLSATRQIKLKRNPHNLFEPKIEALDREIESRKAQVASLEEARANIPRRIDGAANDAERDSLVKELESAKTNLKVNREELQEFVYRKELFVELNTYMHTSLDKESITRLMDETKSRMTEVTTALNEAVQGTDDYEELRAEIKNLGSKQRALTKRYNEAVLKEASEELLTASAPIHIFTSNIPVPKPVNDIIDKLANSYYMSTLRNALGRRDEVEIQDDSFKVHEGKKAGSYAFNVVLTDGLEIASGTYKKSSNTALVTSAWIFAQNLGGEANRKIESAPLAVLVGSRNGYSSFSMEAWQAQSNTVVATLAKGPFFSTEQNAASYQKGIKTKESEKSAKMLFDQSASIVTVHGDSTVSHTTLKSQQLRDERIKDDIEEKAALEKLLKRKETLKPEQNEGHDPELERAVVMSMRPSEIEDRRLAYVSEKQLRSTVPHSGDAVPADAERITCAVITDAHIGNNGDTRMLKAAAKDAMGAHVLVLDGDNIEGNLGNFKYTARPENDMRIMDEYEKWLQGKGLEEGEVTRAKLERYERREKSVISNIDAQAEVFVDAIKDLIFDIASRDGYVAIISGNHYNKTHRDSQHDEATLIRSHIDMLLGGFARSGKIPENWSADHVKIGSGSDMAAETFELNGVGFEVRHAHPAKEHSIESFLEHKRDGAQVVLGGHWHESKQVVTKGNMVGEGPTMQATATNPYNKLLHIPYPEEDRLNGYLKVELLVKDGEVVGHTYEPRLRDALKVREEHFPEFLKDRKVMKVRT